MNTGPSSRALLLAALAILIALVAASEAAQDDVEQRAHEIAAGLRCPVCQNLSVADSGSEMAADMRSLIVAQLREGRSPDEIRTYFVSKYGQWILLSPDPRGIGLLVWVLPGLASLGALAGGGIALRRWSRRRATSRGDADGSARALVRARLASGRPALELDDDGRRLLEALQELDFDHRAGKLSDTDHEELRDLYERRAADVIAQAGRARGAPVPEATILPATPGTARRDAAIPARRLWRWAAAGAFLFLLGTAIGVYLAGSMRPRDGGSLTGDLLTGTGGASGDIAVLLGQGQAAWQREDYRTATALFTRVLSMDPDQPTANAYRGLLLHRGGHAERALDAFERALARDPALAPALWGKGLVLFEALGRPDEAVQTWQALLRLGLADDERRQVQGLVARAQARTARSPAASETRR